MLKIRPDQVPGFDWLQNEFSRRQNGQHWTKAILVDCGGHRNNLDKRVSVSWLAYQTRFMGGKWERSRSSLIDGLLWYPAVKVIKIGTSRRNCAKMIFVNFPRQSVWYHVEI